MAMHMLVLLDDRGRLAGEPIAVGSLEILTGFPHPPGVTLIACEQCNNCGAWLDAQDGRVLSGRRPCAGHFTNAAAVEARVGGGGGGASDCCP